MNAAPSPSQPVLCIQEIVRQVAQDLQPEVNRRQVEVELDLPAVPLYDGHRVESIRQAISLLLADTVLRAEIGEPLLITLVGDAQNWELEIADAHQADEDEVPRMEWMAHWPPLQRAIREFTGKIDVRRCPQGGWAVTLRGAVAQSQRAAG